MIDLHSHILPGIDDGAADEDQALEMAQNRVIEGRYTDVTALPSFDTPVATPNDFAMVFSTETISDNSFS